MRSLIKGLAAGAVFYLLRFVLDSSFVISIGVAVISLMAANLAFPQRRKTKKPLPDKVKEEPKIDVSGLGIDQKDFDRALREGSRKLATLGAAVTKIRDQRVRATGQAISDLVARILNTIRQDPKDLKAARKFLEYYLDATVKVVEQYVSLSSRGVENEEIRRTLERVEKSLDTIRQAYEKQLEQLLQNDVMDLDTELKVLEQTIKMEGLGGDL